MTRIEDPNGNAIEISYTPGVTSADNVLYPQRIPYGKNGSFVHTFKVELVWTLLPAGVEALVSSMHGFRTVWRQYLSRMLVVDGRSDPGSARAHPHRVRVQG